MHEMAQARELELERQGKRKKEEQTQTHQAKKFKLAGQKSEARRDLPKCAKSGNRIRVSVEWAFGYATSVESRVILAENVK